MTEEILLQFAAAWKDGNIESVLNFFSKDAIYLASVGPEPGKTYSGKEEIKQGIDKMMKNDMGSIATIKNIRVNNAHGFWEWTYHFQDGSEQRGCDLFEFEGDKIKVKNAFRKVYLIKQQ